MTRFSDNQTQDTAVAIVAMACRLPGADSPAAFWDAMIEGKSPICETPKSWLDPELYFDPKPGKTGKTYSRIAAIFDFQKVEAEIQHHPFPDKFQSEDPVLKLAYIVAEEVLSETAVWKGEKNIGVYLAGLRASDVSYDYMLSTTAETVFESLHELPEFAALPIEVQSDVIRRSTLEAAKRFRHENCWRNGSPNIGIGDFVTDLRNTFGWTGPAYSLDAACSSSLVALDCARMDILSGRVRGALVGAVSSMSMLSPILFSKNCAATATMSRPFDAQADGLVGAMGIVFTFLKTLAQAEQDGDNILGVIRGVGFSSDGHGKSLWAPKPEGQLLALRRAYEDARMNPEQLSYLEAHATSSGIGDSIELKTIEKLLTEIPGNEKRNRATKKLAIGSFKSHFGHPFEAAGFVSLMKVLQVCKHGTIPPQINISQLHPDLCNRELPFFVPLERTPLIPTEDEQQIFGINSFGVGGLNTHLVLEEYRPKNSSTETTISTVRPETDKTPIAVLGIGCVYPGAFSTDAFWTILYDKINPKQPLSPQERRRRFFSDKSATASDPLEEMISHGGYIEDYLYDWRRHRIPPLQIQRCDPLQTFVMGAVDEAILTATGGGRRNFTEKEHDETFVVAGSDHYSNYFHEFLLSLRAPEFAQIARRETETVLHHSDATVLSAEILDALAKDFAKKIVKDHPGIADVTGSFCSSSLASRITKLYDLHGGAFTIDGGAISSLIALDYSVQKLRQGKSSLGICLGAYRWTNAHAVEYHAAKHHAAAFPLAEGAGAVVLKPLPLVDDKLETPIGMILDMVSVTNLIIDKSVWEQFGFSADDLAVLSIASPLPSKHLTALSENFHSAGRSKPIPLTTCRDQLGNLCAGAGMSEMIKTLLILQYQLIPPQFDWQTPLINSGLFFVPKSAVPLNSTNRQFAVVLDLDENGNGYAAVLAPSNIVQKNIEEVIGTKLRPVRFSNSMPLFGAVSAEADGSPEKSAPVYRYSQAGTPYEMGFGLGVAQAVKIARLIEAYKNVSSVDRADLLYLSRAEDTFSADEADELRGIADGSGVPFEELFYHNVRFYSGLTGREFSFRNSGRWNRVFIFESPLRKTFAGNDNVHLTECEPATAAAHLRLGALGCAGGLAAWNSNGEFVSVTPKLSALPVLHGELGSSAALHLLRKSFASPSHLCTIIFDEKSNYHLF